MLSSSQLGFSQKICFQSVKITKMLRLKQVMRERVQPSCVQGFKHGKKKKKYTQTTILGVLEHRMRDYRHKHKIDLKPCENGSQRKSCSPHDLCYHKILFIY